ncbi:MAG: carbon-nitrogen hydrolase family protein [Thermoleophilia bacterium]
MSRGTVRVAVVQPRSAIRSLAGAIDFRQDVPESQNLARAETWVRRAAAEGARLVAFPELFPGPSDAGDDPSPEQAVEAMRALAADTGTCVAFGGMRPAAGGGRHNAYHLADGPSGRLWTQDKLLPAIGERAVPGSGSVVAEVDGLRVGVAICWEAWFPEVPRARALAGADLLLFPTGAIVQEVHDVWLSVVAARAAENTCYAACSVNLLGVERGMAAVHGPEGPLGARDDEGLLLADLDLGRLDTLRAADDELTTLKRYATLPGLLRALPEGLVRDQLDALRASREPVA